MRGEGAFRRVPAPLLALAAHPGARACCFSCPTNSGQCNASWLAAPNIKSVIALLALDRNSLRALPHTKNVQGASSSAAGDFSSSSSSSSSGGGTGSYYSSAGFPTSSGEQPMAFHADLDFPPVVGAERSFAHAPRPNP